MPEDDSDEDKDADADSSSRPNKKINTDLNTEFTSNSKSKSKKISKEDSLKKANDSHHDAGSLSLLGLEEGEAANSYDMHAIRKAESKRLKKEEKR